MSKVPENGPSVKYEEWLAKKRVSDAAVGIPDATLGTHLFPYQRDLVAWALRRGRAAMFADTGLGKTSMQVEWARVVSERAGRVLILAPLAVAEQTVAEARRFGVSVVYARHGDETNAPIVITNYEMAHHFSAREFAGVVLDESSILKSYDGSTRTMLVEMFSRTPYRLACTATPAPNDHVELGNHSEFLGIKTRVEMLAEYFVHDGGSTSDWRLKGHAKKAFWTWVCSWAASIRLPSDLGYDDDGFILPELRMHERVIPISHRDAWSQGMLFAPEAKTLNDQRATRRATMAKRVDAVAEIVAEHPDDPWIVWCELNDESDAIEAAVPGAIQVAGSDSVDEKRDRLVGFTEGRYRIMVSKPSIAGFGMNWQHCSRMVFVGASNSYEQTYQAIRRCWRFGQKRPVDVWVIRAENEGAIVQNMKRKERDADVMRASMIGHMKEIQRKTVRMSERETNRYEAVGRIVVPSWLRGEAP